MSNHIREEGRRALEEEFFARLDIELKENLRKDRTRREALEELSKASGIKNPTVLEIMLDAQVTPSTLQALSLVPLVCIAWADGKIQAKEQEAILRAASEFGLTLHHPGHDALRSWLQVAPSETLFNIWQLHVRELGMTMDRASFQKVREEILGHAEKVATAAGGFLGLRSNVSKAERLELSRIDEAFEMIH